VTNKIRLLDLFKYYKQLPHQINPDLQTDESAKLGGAMSIHAPWKR
jgi:hypothetical protein